MSRGEGKSGATASVVIPAEDLLHLTEGVELVVEIEPATGSRLKGSYWVATLPSLGVQASALGLDETIEALAGEAARAASEVLRGNEFGRQEMVPAAVRVLALEKLPLGRVVNDEKV
ncbi:MAG: hypothetical protein ACO3ZZ_09350, partial [Solirubrobacterales bacterium]